MVNEVVLHIGAHKTASTFIANALKSDQNSLRENGTSILFRKSMKGMQFFKELSQIKKGKFKEGSAAPSEEAKQELDALIKDQEGKLILTNEDLMSSLGLKGFFPHPETSVKYLTDLFDGRKLKIILYTRNQVEYIESIYVQKSQAGKAGTFENFISKGLPKNLDWYHVAQSIKQSSSNIDLTVLPYESIHAGANRFYQNFLTTAGVPYAEDYTIDESSSGGRKANRSFSSKALEVFNLVKPVLNDEELVKMRVFLQNEFSIENYPRAQLLSDEQKKQVSEIYRDSNKKLFDEFLADHKDISNYYFFEEQQSRSNS